MNIFKLIKKDKSLIFKDFPSVDFKRKEATEWVEKHVFISAIGLSQDDDGMSTGTDVFECTFDVDSFAAGTLPREDDLIKYINDDGDEIKLKIAEIARDKGTVSLGMWLCYATYVVPEGMAGQINRELK